ncbi:MAG: hypothetical protein IJ758_02580 [Clostridia bacterium]|nr:hypothetical protein [Clostridia bacterium]
MMNTNQTKEFGRLRAFFWPIHKHELKKFVPMCFLMFFILFVYTLVRDLKDGFLQYQTHIAKGTNSTDLISALKLWYVLPCAFLAVMLFTVLTNKFGSKKTFYIIVVSFMLFFAIFGLFLYPNLDSIIMPADQVANIVNSVPKFFRTFLTCLVNWPVTLFYIFSEIWGTMAISSLFWQFANATTMSFEVKRFFGLFPIIGNIGSYVAAEAVAKASKNLTIQNVQILMLLVVVSGILVLATYTLIHKWVLTDINCFDPTKVKSKKKKKQKVSIFEGIKILFTNSYMGLVAMLVIGYGMAINFSEVIMKDQMKTLCTTPGEYLHMYSTMSKIISLLTIFVTIFASNILRRCKWKTAALVTPSIFLFAGAIFFALTLYNKFVNPQIFGFSALAVAVWAGMIQDALAKSVKYTLFDTTKSMAYIPLDEDTKTKGQAAVEVVGGRAGKAGASLIQQVMYGFTPGVMNHVISILILFATAVVGWIVSVFRLSPKYEKAIEEQSDDD